MRARISSRSPTRLIVKLVADTFGRADSDRVRFTKAYGPRPRSNGDLLGDWRAAITAPLGRPGLSLPD
ncbi:MAG: hypothetical protein QF827_11080 [Alphaproteobacteria bacterium]|mgnify:FL=1|nr:hypothetical protein [Alphaproteobacteria bacterium]